MTILKTLLTLLLLQEGATNAEYARNLQRRSCPSGLHHLLVMELLLFNVFITLGLMSIVFTRLKQ